MARMDRGGCEEDDGDEPSEVEPGRRLYGRELERWLLGGDGVRPGGTVLELASGFGAMCLALAERVRPGGSTICSDLHPERVEATRRRVHEAGHGDVDVRVLDMLRLDLADEGVDAIVCRWGFMLPVPPEQAFAEAFRVLRRGGELRLAVWAEPARNPWIGLVDDALRATGHVTPADRREPGRMFSLADPVRLRALMAETGFDPIVVDEIALRWGYDDFDAYWDEEALVAGPYEDYLRSLSATDSEAVRGRLRASLEPWRSGRLGYRIPGVALVASARRPM
jgi:SAM-dependent methyltransferase